MGLVLGTVNLSDRTKYKYTEGDEQPNFNIKITSAGGSCGGAAVSGFPTVEIFAPVYWVRPLRVLSLGTTIDAVQANHDAVLAEIVAANTKARVVYLERNVLSQTNTMFWTVLGGVPKRVLQHWDGIKKMWVDLDLYVYPGQYIPGGVS